MQELNNAQTAANSLATDARRFYGVEICCSDEEQRNLIAAAQAYLDSGGRADIYDRATPFATEERQQLSLFGAEARLAKARTEIQKAR